MHIKYSIQGLLIYIALAIYILAFMAAVIRLRKSGRIIFFVGFIVCCVSYGYRWFLVEHFPLQNLFEVFSFLACIIYPLSIISKKLLKTPASTIDSILGALFLVPAGFIFSDKFQFLPPQLQNPFFVPQIAIYLIADVFMFKASITALGILIGFKNRQTELVDFEEAQYRLVCAGFPLLTLALVLGCLFTLKASADWWAWNPDQMWPLATWLVFAGYFFYRAAFGTNFPKLNSLWILTGFVLIVITLLWPVLAVLFIA